MQPQILLFRNPTGEDMNRASSENEPRVIDELGGVG